MQSLTRPGSQAEQAGRLLLAGLVVVMLPALPLASAVTGQQQMLRASN